MTLHTALQVCDLRGFGPSLSACPKLEHFMSYKLRSLRLRKGIAHKLNLPKCASPSLWLAKDLTRIEIAAPRLNCLNLQVREARPVSGYRRCSPSQAPLCTLMPMSAILHSQHCRPSLAKHLDSCG